MTISNKINPNGDLKQIWKLVLKNIHIEEGIHKAPAIYAEVSGIIGLLYILMFLAIGGDIYLAFNILIKAGVKPAFVAIQVILDFFLAILPFILLSIGLKFMDKISIKSWILFYELDSKLVKRNEDEQSTKTRRERASTNLDTQRSMLFWCKVVMWIISLSIFAIAYWKIHTYSSTVPYSIWGTAKGKMVVTVAILVALFHVIATENAVVHLLYWMKKTSAEKRAERQQNLNEEPAIFSIPIIYKGDYKKSKSGYTELVINQDQSAEIRYAYIIRDEEINNLVAQNPDHNARMGIIATCKEFQLR